MQTNRFLFADDAFDLAILDLFQRLGADFAARAFLPRVFERRRAQQTADVVGAKRRFGSLHALAPHFIGDFDDKTKLRPLLVFGQHIAFLGRGEAALRGQAELIERTYLVAASIRRLMSSFFSRAPFLEVISPSTSCLLPFGKNRSGSKLPERSSSYSRK